MCPASNATPESFDFFVVGAGFAGATLARLVAESGKRVLVIDRRPHLAGNAYDFIDPSTGIRVHKYGPHLFHTNHREVWEFLSRFTAWLPYEHRAQSCVDGKLYPFPINIDTVNALYGTHHTEATIEGFYASVRETREIRNSEDSALARVGRDLYEKFFKNYTKKQWDLWPSELDRAVMERIPLRTNHDDRYFADTYQAMPAEGYTGLFEKMLAHPNITVRLETDYRDVRDKVTFKELIYTGCIDAFFDSRYGKLPYRSVAFEWQHLPEHMHQPVMVVNYPNDFDYTRKTEYKHLPGNQPTEQTVISREYPKAEGDPYYPIPRPENDALYQKYKALADALPHVHFIGRLAEYKYYNQDKVVESALTYFKKHFL
jgi:UDP-galactopyranose mutase